ncbi:hypothetical protein GLYMA_18G122650v4 [Glycine max]|nr:hypothetical protein GLYMA_18G122650v4 [Glycine max]KAH1154238.1 hypothetical protein GYH30_049759 [Glycine max]
MQQQPNTMTIIVPQHRQQGQEIAKVNMNKIPTMVKHLVKEGMPLSLGTSTSLNSTMAEFSADPGFAEKATKLCCFGSRSFNGMTTQLCLNIAELAQRSSPLV